MRVLLFVLVLMMSGIAIASGPARQGGPVPDVKETEKPNPLLRATDAKFRPVAELLLVKFKGCAPIVFVNRYLGNVEAQISCTNNLRIAIDFAARDIKEEKGDAILQKAILDPRVYQRAVDLMGRNDRGKK